MNGEEIMKLVINSEMPPWRREEIMRALLIRNNQANHNLSQAEAMGYEHQDQNAIPPMEEGARQDSDEYNLGEAEELADNAENGDNNLQEAQSSQPSGERNNLSQYHSQASQPLPQEACDPVVPQGIDPTATQDNNFQVPSMQVSAHDYSSTSSSQQQQQEQQQHQQQETARYYLSVEGDENGQQDQDTSTCSRNDNFHTFTIPLGPHSSKVISTQTESMNVQNNDTSTSTQSQPFDATINIKSSLCLLDKGSTPDNIMYERNDNNATPGLTFSIPPSVENRMFGAVTLNTNYQDQPGTSSSSKSVEVQHQPKITLSEKTGLIEIEGTINNGQDDQENDDNTGVNDLHQSDAVNSGAPEDEHEKNEGHSESRNDDDVFDEQPGTSAQSFGQPQEGKNKGEELRESNDSISVAANDESANSAGGSADQNKNQLVPKSWWMSNTQIKKEKEDTPEQKPNKTLSIRSSLLDKRSSDKYLMIKVIRVLQELETAEIHFRVKQTTQLGKLKRSYSERVAVPIYLLRFLYDGKRIIDEHTPEILEMESGDVIEVYDELGNGASCNTQNAGNLQQRRRQLSCSSSNSETLTFLGNTEIKQENIKQEEYREYEENPSSIPGPSNTRYNGYSYDNGTTSNTSNFHSGPSNPSTSGSSGTGPLRLRGILRPSLSTSSDSRSRKRQLTHQSSQEENITIDRASLTSLVGRKRTRLTDTLSDNEVDSEEDRDTLMADETEQSEVEFGDNQPREDENGGFNDDTQPYIDPDQVAAIVEEVEGSEDNMGGDNINGGALDHQGGVQDAQQHHGLGDGGNDGGGEEGQGRGDNEHTQMMLDTARVELDKYKKKYENLVRKLRDKVECPVCYEVPKRTPVPVCSNGHVVCMKCIRNECPTCRASMTGATCLLAATVITEIEHDCKWEGCREQYPIQTLKDHEKKCLHRQVECPCLQCPLKFPVSRLLEHLLQCCVGEITCNLPQSFRFTIRRDGKWKLMGIKFDGKIFLLRMALEERLMSRWSVTVLMLGGEESCSNYTADITVCSADPNSRYKKQYVGDVCPIDISSVTKAIDKDFCLMISDAAMDKILYRDPLTRKLEFIVNINIMANNRPIVVDPQN